MRKQARERRARLRDRRRGTEWDRDESGLIGPLSRFDLFMSLLASARRAMQLREALGLPFELSAMERAALPRQQAVRIEGRMNGDGRLMFLLSDPGRPSKVYERVMAERRERAPQNDSGGPQSDVVTDW